ncbi:MAG: TM0106 family RecB-like putative nuclease [Elusimicrobiaceae bacterium]|nr:TM0106 family RecB-like putative nuclease [Elusimicrobiaceae bacterium]
MTEQELQQLVAHFSAGRTPDGQDFNASRMYTLLEEPFCIWCQFHAPQKEAVAESNRYENLKVRTDRNSRDEWIKEEFPTVFFVEAHDDLERFTGTLAAMARGESAIANAALWNLPENVYGSINLLVKTDTAPSRFGPYHYEIYQFKRAHDLKEHYALQVSLMNQILGQVQGYTPAKARVFLKGRTVDVSHADHAQRLAHELAFWRNIKSGLAKPEAHKPPKAAASPWRVYANKLMAQTKDLIMLPHLNTEMRQCLKINGLFTTDDVAHAPLAKLQEILEEPYATETYYNARAYLHNKPILRQSGHFPPPDKKYNLYFDFEATETFTKDNKSFVYLIGIWDKEQNKYVSFVAKTPEEEINIFEQFYQYIQDFENTALYHWTEYEVRKMRKLAMAWPDKADHLNKLCDLCCDLKVCVNDAFYLPAPSFSLKAAAPAFGFNWRQDDCGAMDSMVYFTNWLKTGDEKLLRKILMYNEDDCKAMLALENALKEAEVLSPNTL